MKKTFLIRVITIVIVIDGINGTSNLLLKLILPYAPYLAQQFSKLHRLLHFWPSELKFCLNLVHYKAKKIAKFQPNISDRSREICVPVTAPKKSRAQQYNEKKTIFTNYTNLDHFWAKSFYIVVPWATVVSNRYMTEDDM